MPETSNGKSSQSDQTVYYIVSDDEGIWIMTQRPKDDDEILFETNDLHAAESALCIELARCD